jgi:hypothetical protein
MSMNTLHAGVAKTAAAPFPSPDRHVDDTLHLGLGSRIVKSENSPEESGRDSIGLSDR